jgi:hypothetical protein
MNSEPTKNDTSTWLIVAALGAIIALIAGNVLKHRFHRELNFRDRHNPRTPH